MKYILDTHVLIWWFSNNYISKEAHSIISTDKNIIFVSVASVWEISIKKALKKLQAPDDLEEVIKLNNFEPLSINVEHASFVEKLPQHHKDPFDRLLIAQAKIEDLILITRDQKLSLYDIKTIIA